MLTTIDFFFNYFLEDKIKKNLVNIFFIICLLINNKDYLVNVFILFLKNI